MDIKLASKENIKDLYNLWQICFGDDKETIDMFFNNSFDSENTVVCVDNQKVVAMMFLLPQVIKSSKKEYSSYYLYALGTEPSYRSKGIMGKMIEYAASLARERHIDYLFLVPASESLFGYYKNHGFQNAFGQKKVVIDREILNSLKSSDGFNLVNFNSANYRNLKNSNLSNQSFVDWRENEINLANDYFKSGNGEIVSTEKGDCFIEHSKSRDIVYDLTVQADDLCSMLNTISNHIISDEIEFNLSKNYSLVSDKQEYYDCGMIRKLNDNLDDLNDCFMGLTLQ